MPIHNAIMVELDQKLTKRRRPESVVAIDDARVIGVDEKEGLLDFGPMRRLQEIRGALLMK